MAIIGRLSFDGRHQSVLTDQEHGFPSGLVRKAKRVLAAVGVIVAAGVTPLIAASSASATVAQCTGIVQSYGYVVGAKVTTACGYGKLPTGSGTTADPICVSKLVQMGANGSFERRSQKSLLVGLMP